MSNTTGTTEQRLEVIIQGFQPRLQTSFPKIQKVARHLRDRKHFDKHYSPKLVSFGPIHHGAENLQLGEQYKHYWTRMHVNSTGQVAEDPYKRIADNIEELKDLFDKDLFSNDESCEKLSWMLFVDGCSLLYILEKGVLGTKFYYDELGLKYDQLILVRQDALLLENQLPYEVLRLLSRPENALWDKMDKFLVSHHLWPEPCRIPPGGKQENTGQERESRGRPPSSHANLQPASIVAPQPPRPIHLLDHLRNNILKDCHEEDYKKAEKKEVEDIEITHRNLQELKAAGIKLKKIESGRLKEIDFDHKSAELKLPPITVDDTTATTYHNLIAYEMCPDFRNNYGISSFVALLDSLIDHPDDVKQLRSEGILLNALGSDEEVSTLFNTISNDLVADVHSYSGVRADIQKHCDAPWTKHKVQLKTRYFSSPWATIGLVAAGVLFILAFLQTVFTILH